MMQFPSRILETAIRELSKLPGVGKKTAVRFALHLIRQNGETEKLIHSLTQLKNELRYCKTCHNISDREICFICSDTTRLREVVCVVEDIRDVMAIESTGQYKGVYHVLGGVISPIEGIGPDNLNINPLLKKVTEEKIREVILALSTTMEGDTTNFYLYKRLKETPVLISTIARGVAIGNELEYTDEITLARSIINRIPYEAVLLTK